jgi:hypothetical protein
LVCRAHGAASPQAKAAAERRLADAAAERAVAKFGLPVVTTAQEALLDELARANGRVLWLTAQCQELATKGELTWGLAKRTVRPGTAGGQPQTVEVTLAAALHPFAQWLERAERHRAAVAAEIKRLGLEERQVRISEVMAAQMRAITDAALRDAGLTQEQQARVAAAFPGAIRRLTAVPDA